MAKSPTDHSRDRKVRAAEARRTELSRLMRAHPNETQAWYAEQIGLTTAWVCKTVRRIRSDWRIAILRDTNEMIIDELARLDFVEQEAQEAWERSKKNREETTRRQSGASAGGEARLTAQVRTRAQTGDPKFLAVILECRAAKRKILGLDAPVKIDARVQFQKEREVISTEAVRIIMRHAQGLTPEQIEQIAADFEKLSRGETEERVIEVIAEKSPQ